VLYFAEDGTVNIISRNGSDGVFTTFRNSIDQSVDIARRGRHSNIDAYNAEMRRHATSIERIQFLGKRVSGQRTFGDCALPDL
jgi:hypothetical protein